MAFVVHVPLLMADSQAGVTHKTPGRHQSEQSPRRCWDAVLLYMLYSTAVFDPHKHFDAKRRAETIYRHKYQKAQGRFLLSVLRSPQAPSAFYCQTPPFLLPKCNSLRGPHAARATALPQVKAHRHCLWGWEWARKHVRIGWRGCARALYGTHSAPAPPPEEGGLPR